VNEARARGIVGQSLSAREPLLRADQSVFSSHRSNHPCEAGGPGMVPECVRAGEGLPCRRTIATYCTSSADERVAGCGNHPVMRAHRHLPHTIDAVVSLAPYSRPHVTAMALVGSCVRRTWSWVPGPSRW